MDKYFIVSHTHWDREWYAEFEKYRWYLVRTMDAILENFEKDERFSHFHLDGQTVVLDDYLEIRPQNREKIAKLIEDGRLAIGPWYVLQDEFLTSGEANVRNLMRGLKSAKEYSSAAKVGYLPDTFGHFSQMPQILRGFGIDNAIFCRGLSSSFDAMRQEKTTASPSECIWVGSDGSEVLGLFGPEWYNNLNELNKNDPSGHIRAAVNNLKRVNPSDNYLLYNGCDHQPLQKNMPDLLERARAEIPEADIRWTGFEEYVSAVRGSVSDGLQLVRVQGELTSQDTDGLFSFVHTASVRFPIKRANARCQSLLETKTEPISVFAELEGKPYDKDYIDYCWDLLMKNHAHDSICGCGIDPVYREMGIRFEKCRTAAECVTLSSAQYIADRVSGADGVRFVVFNPSPETRLERAVGVADFPVGSLKEGGTFFVCKGEKEVRSNVLSISREFDYGIPEDSFRIGFNCERVKVEFEAEVPAFGYATYVLKMAEKAPKKMEVSHKFENGYYAFELKDDGTFDLVDKKNGKIMYGMNAFEDGGNVGNEYTYYAPAEDKIISTKGVKAEISASANLLYTRYTVKHVIAVPKGFEKLDKEGKTTVSYDGSVNVAQMKAMSKRTEETVDITLESEITLYANSPRIEIKTRIDNKAGNHRIRAVFPHSIKAEGVTVHTPFDFVERAYSYKPNWTLSDKSDRMQAFCAVNGEANLFLTSRGVYEYEAKENVLYLTLLNAVDELGDWGYVPTPEAQAIGVSEFEYALVVGCSFEEGAKQAVYYSEDGLVCVTAKGEGALPMEKSYIQGKTETLFSALKKAEDGNGYILRTYNPFTETKRLDAFIDGFVSGEVSLAEEELGERQTSVKAKKISCVRFKKA